MNLRGILTIVVLLASTTLPSSAQQRIGIAYYDVDHLYDTIPSPFYNDSAYTPAGRLKWSAERYERKIRQVAATIDSMALPVVALWGVENEAVVRDIAAACRGEYSYLHRTLDNSFDGMDFALLYYGDVFQPVYDEAGRRYLFVEGVVRYAAQRPRHNAPSTPSRRDTVGLVLCSDTRMAQWVVGDLRRERPSLKLVVMGRTASLDAAGHGLSDALERAARLGRGNISVRGNWQMRDRILVDSACHAIGGDVYARSYLLDPSTAQPAPTYRRERYLGGQSYALPVYTYLE